MSDSEPDDLLRALRNLATPPPSAVRDARIRARCHVAIRRHAAEGAIRWPGLFRLATLSPVGALLACGLGAYGVLIAVEALRLVRSF